MKTIIAGSRDIHSAEGMMAVKAAIKASKFAITEVVSGGARGVDSLGEVWAHSMGVPIKRFPAKWKEHGKGAGFIRNAQMVDYADALIAVWDGESRGTAHTIRRARKDGLKVSVTYISEVQLGSPDSIYGVHPVVNVPLANEGDRYLVVPLE